MFDNVDPNSTVRKRSFDTNDTDRSFHDDCQVPKGRQSWTGAKVCEAVFHASVWLKGCWSFAPVDPIKNPSAAAIRDKTMRYRVD